MRRILWFVFVVGLALTWAARPTPVAAASGPDTPSPRGDQVVMGDDFVLPSGETLHGDLVVLAGSATLEPGSRVRGDVVIMGGQGRIAGQVDGDAVVMGGQLTLQSGAWVRGDVVVLGGVLTREAGARVDGRVVENPIGVWRGFAPSITVTNRGVPWAWSLYHGVVRGLWGVSKALVVAALAALVALFAPQPLQRAGDAARRYPWQSAVLGLAAAVLSAVLGLVLILLIVGIPVALLLFLVLALAYLFGLLAVGWLVGHRLGEAFGRPWPPVLEAALGSLLFMLLMAGLDVLGCLGWPVQVALGLWALGAALLTYGGTRPAEQALAHLSEALQPRSGENPPPAASEGPGND